MKHASRIALAAVLLISSACLGQVEIRDVLNFVPPENARSPWGVAVDEGRNLAYVAGYRSPYRLGVIDGATRAIVNNVALSGISPRGLCFYPALDRVYAANSGSSTVSVVDAEAQIEIATIPVGNASMDICVDTSSGLLYVANEADGTVSVLDAYLNVPVDTIPVGGLPYDVCANSLTRRIYVANRGSSTISVIDGATGQVVATIAVGDGPSGICVNEATNLIYVAQAHGNSVSVIDGASNQVIDTIPVGRKPQKVCADSGRNLIYVVNTDDESVSVIDATSDTVIETVRVGHYPLGGIAVNCEANEVYVANSESEDVSVIDGVGSRVVATVRVAWFPHEIGVDPSSDRWFVTNSSGNDVACLESGSAWAEVGAGCIPDGVQSRLWDVGVGYSPSAIAFCNQLAGVEVDRLYVATVDSVDAGDRVVVIDTHSGGVLDTIPVGNTPQGVSLNQATDRLYVANHADSTLYVRRASTGDPIATVALPHKPMDVEVNTTTNIVFVPTWFGVLYAIDGWTNTIIASVELHGFCEPNHIAVNESANKVYVTSLNCTLVWVVDGEDFTVEAAVPTTGFPDQVAVNPILGKAYVCTGKYLTVIGPDNAIAQEVWLLKMTGCGCSVRQDSGLVYVGCPYDGSVIVLLDDDIAGVGEGDGSWHGGAVPVLSPVSPNPCCDHADVSLAVPAGSKVRLAIQDIRGRLVRTLAATPCVAATEGVDSTGKATVTGMGTVRMTASWDGTDSNGDRAAPGIYVVRLESGGVTLAQKICKTR